MKFLENESMWQETDPASRIIFPLHNIAKLHVCMYVCIGIHRMGNPAIAIAVGEVTSLREIPVWNNCLDKHARLDLANIHLHPHPYPQICHYLVNIVVCVCKFCIHPKPSPYTHIQSPIPYPIPAPNITITISHLPLAWITRSPLYYIRYGLRHVWCV